MGVVVAESFCLRVCRGDIQQQESGRRTSCSCVSAQAARLQRRDPSGRGGRYHSSADSHAPERRAGGMRRASWTTPSLKPRGGWGTTAAEGGEGVSFIQGGRVRRSLRYRATTDTKRACNFHLSLTLLLFEAWRCCRWGDSFHLVGKV